MNNIFEGDPKKIKQIKGYEGFYSVSRNGEIISHGKKSNHELPIKMKLQKDKDGYNRVLLSKNKKRKTFRVCRLVASTYIQNKNNLPIVNHINKIKDDDRVENLEWCDNYYNWKHSEEEMPNKEIAVEQYTLDGKFIKSYKNLMEAGRQNNINQGNITNCLKGKCKSVGGYKWKKI